MGLFSARWSEERLEKWFQARCDRWIDERLSSEFDQRMQVWADGHLQDRFEALFAARFEKRMLAWTDGHFQDRFNAGFDSRISAWKDTDLKKAFDAWVAHWFDNLFKVWANTWADSPDFRERFVRNFAAQFHDRLDNEVKARVANEIYTLIDKRIEQWLLAVRRELLETTPPTADPEPAHPGDSTAQEPASSDDDTPPGEPVATAAELAAFLAKGPIQPQQIRKILKGKEIPGRSPKAYPLGEAAAALLLRKGRQSKRPQPDAPKKRQDTTGS